jgi:UTP:GlnB (protein PII) uridylyltransferase
MAARGPERHHPAGDLMRGGDASVSVARAAEIESVIDRVTRWASGRSDVAGLLLVGSCARGAARPSSDVDFVLLTTVSYAVASASGPAM